MTQLLDDNLIAKCKSLNIDQVIEISGKDLTDLIISPSLGFKNPMKFKLTEHSSNAEKLHAVGELFNESSGSVYDKKKAIAFHEKSASLGNNKSMFALGKLYQESDIGKALIWYENAIEKGDVETLSYLGDMYYNGHGIAKDVKKGKSYLAKSIKLGCTPAFSNLGINYLCEIADDSKTSVYDSKEAVYFELSVSYTINVGLANNEEHAISLLLESYKMQPKNAEVIKEVPFIIGLLYENKLNFEDAVLWYKKAINAGNSNAMYKAGLLYVQGRGVTRSPLMAVKLFDKAASLGHLGSVSCAAYFAFNVELKIAYNWNSKMADQGNKEAMTRLGLIYDQGLGVAVDYPRAFKLYQQAAKLNEKEALTIMGSMYLHGRGFGKTCASAELLQHEQYLYREPNYKLARLFYEKSAALGYDKAYQNLAMIYGNGLGVPQDQQKGFELLEKAADLGSPAAISELKRLRAIVEKNKSLGIY